MRAARAGIYYKMAVILAEQKEKDGMRTEIILATEENGFIIKNMYPLYLHDLAGIHGTLSLIHI